jgi:hypothetical protein
MATLGLGVGFLILLLSTCNGDSSGLDNHRPSFSEPAWQELQQKTPLSYLTPVPIAQESQIDGLYVKVDLSAPQAWLCRRCADYRPAGGIWRLQLEQGVMRIFYEVTGWRSLSSFAILDDRIFFFNDPYCPEVVGEYRWTLQDGHLTMDVISDECSILLRGLNLSQQTWSSCEIFPDRLVGCSSVEVPNNNEVPLPPGVSVNVHEGDSRFFDVPPELFLNAGEEHEHGNTEFSLKASESSIEYGLNRILWWGGNWLEASARDDYQSYGVQFLGDPQIGWARILIDDNEVWRGNTSEIWSKHGRHGGYVEILVESPGQHKIRVESLDFDYRPVTVAGFGFRYQDGVEGDD